MFFMLVGGKLSTSIYKSVFSNLPPYMKMGDKHKPITPHTIPSTPY